MLGVGFRPLPDWTPFEAGETIEFAGRQYPALYTPRNDTLINLFEISAGEQVELTTIVSRDEARRRDAERKRAQRAQARAAREADRQAPRRGRVDVAPDRGASACFYWHSLVSVRDFQKSVRIT